MATNKTNNVIAKIGKGLVKTSAEEIANLTGVPVPSDVGSAAALGAPAKSQDMMGTPANVRNAIKVNLEDKDVKKSLATKERQGRVQETKEKERGVAEASIATATSLFGRVGNAIQKQIETAGQQKLAVTVKPEAEQGILEGIDPSLIQSARDELAKVASSVAGEVPQGSKEEDTNVAFRKSVAKLNKMGITGEQIRNALGLDQQAWTDKLLESIPDDIKMGSLEVPDTLSSQVAQLKAALNLKDTDYGNLTWTEFKNKVQNRQKEEFADVNGLRALAFDPLAPAQLKQEANRRLRELGQAGVYGEYEETEKLNETLEKADKVQIGGQIFSMEEILDDDVSADLIKQNLDTPEKLKGTAFESLIPVIQGHRTALYTRLADVNKAQQVIDSNLKALPTYKQVGDMQLPEAVMNILHPDLLNEDVQLGVRLPLEANSTPLYKSITSLAKDTNTINQAKALVTEMSGLVANEAYKPVAQWLSGKDSNWLKANGFLSSEGAPTDKMNTLKSNLSAYSAASDTEANLGQVLGVGTEGTISQLQALASDKEAVNRILKDPNNRLNKLFDANQDGIADASQDIEARIKAAMSNPDGTVNYDKVLAFQADTSSLSPFLDKVKNEQNLLQVNTASWDTSGKNTMQSLVDKTSTASLEAVVADIKKKLTAQIEAEVNKAVGAVGIWNTQKWNEAAREGAAKAVAEFNSEKQLQEYYDAIVKGIDQVNTISGKLRQTAQDELDALNLKMAAQLTALKTLIARAKEGSDWLMGNSKVPGAWKESLTNEDLGWKDPTDSDRATLQNIRAQLKSEDGYVYEWDGYNKTYRVRTVLPPQGAVPNKTHFWNTDSYTWQKKPEGRGILWDKGSNSFKTIPKPPETAVNKQAWNEDTGKWESRPYPANANKGGDKYVSYTWDDNSQMWQGAKDNPSDEQIRKYLSTNEYWSIELNKFNSADVGTMTLDARLAEANGIPQKLANLDAALARGEMHKSDYAEIRNRLESRQAALKESFNYVITPEVQKAAGKTGTAIQPGVRAAPTEIDYNPDPKIENNARYFTIIREKYSTPLDKMSRDDVFAEKGELHKLQLEIDDALMHGQLIYSDAQNLLDKISDRLTALSTYRPKSSSPFYVARSK